MTAAIDHSIASPRLLRIALMLLLMLPTLAHAYAGHDSRYIADDYCTASVATRSTVAQALDHWYSTWSGRYTAVVLLTLLGQPPPQVYAVVIPALLLLWYAASIWVLRRLLHRLGIRSGWLPLLFTALISYALFDGLPNVAQTLYWVTSAVTYVLPLVGLVAYLGLTLTALQASGLLPRFAAALVVGLCLLFIAAGCSETYAVLQATVLGLLLIAAWRFVPVAARPRWTVWLTLGLLVTTIGLAIMLRSPGNSVRQGLFEPIAPLAVVAERTAVTTVAYVFLALGRYTGLPLLVVIVVTAIIAHLTPIPACFGRPSRRAIRSRLLLTLGLMLLIMAATFAPSVYAVSTAPPARVYMLPQTVLVCGTSVWGILIGWGLQSGDPRGQLRRSRVLIYGGGALLVLLLIVGPLAATVRTAVQARSFDTYAAEWDARDRALRAAHAQGQTDVVLAPLSVDMSATAHLDEIGPDPHGDANGCAAGYYGLKTVRTS